MFANIISYIDFFICFIDSPDYMHLSLKEIVEAVKKEIQKMKDEIISGELWCDNCHCFVNDFVKR